jgi:hypothetical protein
MRKLTIIIEAGEKTCFNKTTKTMCPMVLTSHYGTRWHCQLFGKTDEELKEVGTMLQRHPACLEAEERQDALEKEKSTMEAALRRVIAVCQDREAFVMMGPRGFAVAERICEEAIQPLSLKVLCTRAHHAAYNCRGVTFNDWHGASQQCGYSPGHILAWYEGKDPKKHRQDCASCGAYIVLDHVFY